MKSIDWPETIPIPDAVGRGAYWKDYLSHIPCCAIGHRMEATRCCAFNTFPYEEWNNTYTRVHKALVPLSQYPPGKKLQPDKTFSVETLNDAMQPKYRLLVYLTTWAMLGYTEGMPDDVLKAVEKVKKHK